MEGKQEYMFGGVGGVVLGARHAKAVETVAKRFNHDDRRRETPMTLQLP